jgi:hypothetical protein
LLKRVTVKEPPAGALLASKKNKVKPVTKVQKVKKASKQKSTHGVPWANSPSTNYYCTTPLRSISMISLIRDISYQRIAGESTFGNKLRVNFIGKFFDKP